MIIKPGEASERAQLFRTWTTQQPSDVQITINEWRLKLSRIPNISDVSADELLCQIFLRVMDDKRRHG